MPVDLKKFWLDLFPGAIWACRQSPIVISSNLKEEDGTVDKFLKWNLLIFPSNLVAACKSWMNISVVKLRSGGAIFGRIK
jgi:hypothetical protein